MHEQEECHLRSWLEYDSRSTKPGIVLSNVSLVAKGLPTSGKVVSGQWHYRAEHMMLLRLVPIRVTVMVVRFIAILLVAVLLPLNINVPSVMACSTTECCGANCSPGAPVSEVNCCKAPVAPDRAISQAQDALHFDSIATMPAAGVTIAISHLQNTVVARGYSPPDRPASLALLCSRQI